MLHYVMGLSHWWIDLTVIYLFVQGAFFTVFPEEVVLPALGVLWGQGRVGFLEAYASAMFGLACGDVILYGLGHRFGWKVLTRRPFSWILDAEALSGALAKIKRWGDWLVFGVRFTPTVRAPMFFAAGISKMRMMAFLRSDFLGLILWVPLLMFFGRHLGGSGSLEQSFHKLGLIMLVILSSGLALTLFRERQKRKKVQKVSGYF